MSTDKREQVLMLIFAKDHLGCSWAGHMRLPRIQVTPIGSLRFYAKSAQS
jgi:hypothetical protein